MATFRRFDVASAANAPSGTQVAKAPVAQPTERSEPEKLAPARRSGPAPAGKPNHFQDMTDRILARIEEGVVPWRMDWDGAVRWPQSGTKGSPYHGVNVPMLLSQGFQDNRWATVKQANAQGWSIRAGEKGSPIYFHQMIQKQVGEDVETGEPVIKTFPLMRRFIVFNYSQIDGAPQQEFDAAAKTITSSQAERIDDIVAAMGAEVVHGFRVPSFQMDSTGLDRICMPAKDSFEQDSGYYAALLHELVHWTGHPERLNRVFGRDRESPEYAREELRAEIGSAMLCARLGVPHQLENHAGYIDAYLRLLRSDNRELYRASRDAEKAVNLILSHHPELREQIREEATAMAADAKAAGLEEQFDAGMFDYDDELLVDADAVLANFAP
ncbi:MAG: DUF1738 domain-containing protein [Burkholderiaceae bacterium]|nr:MAG: DUF1738 domain-containing protein [Burkholderiaceae bacterium]